MATATGDKPLAAMTVGDPTEITVIRELRCLARYGYGEIVVTVHNNRPTMIEIRKKIKIESPSGAATP